MKKVLILPSTVGQGDLSVAHDVASAFIHEYDVTTACFEQNAHSPLWEGIAGKRVTFQEASHPDHSRSYVSHVSSLSNEILAQSPDIVVALNEPSFGLAAVLANRPVIQLTHFMDPSAMRSGRKVLNAALRFEALSRSIASQGLTRVLKTGDNSHLFELLQRMEAMHPFPLMRRVVRKMRTVMARKKSRLTAELIQRYGRLLGTNYLSQLLSDSLIFHTVFSYESEALQDLNRDRQTIGKSPAILTCSLPARGTLAPALKRDSGTRTLLLTFGGIDHPITEGFLRLMRLLNKAFAQFNSKQLQVVVAGRVVETKRGFFEESFAENPLFREGGINLAGSVDHSRHLQLMADADLVMTQPGYSTLCEMLSADKPFLLFYGLAPYYEQFSNFVAANKAGLTVQPVGNQWLQIGEYDRFGRRRTVREAALLSTISSVLSLLIEGKLSGHQRISKLATMPSFIDAVTTQAHLLTGGSVRPLEIAV